MILENMFSRIFISYQVLSISVTKCHECNIIYLAYSPILNIYALQNVRLHMYAQREGNDKAKEKEIK